VVILLYREAYYLQLAAREPEKKGNAEAQLSQVEFDLELIVAKQRMGPTAPVSVFCDARTSSVRSPRPAGV
jgi:replicative DNA helicase